MISCLNQVIFALNEVYCLNEKKATSMIDKFNVKPEDYSQRVNSIFENLGIDIEESIKTAEDLFNQVQAVCKTEHL